MNLHPADRELLECLIEECAEVQHIACKSLRHGLNSVHPFKENPTTNEEELNREVGQVYAIVDLLRQRNILHVDKEARAMDNKRKSLSRFLHHSDIVDGKLVVREIG